MDARAKSRPLEEKEKIMNTLTNPNMKGIAGIETKHTDSRTWGWTWRSYYMADSTGPSPYQGGRVKDGGLSGYYGYFEDIKRTGAVTGAGYNKEDWSIMLAVSNLAKEIKDLTDEQRAELKEAADLFEQGESWAVRELNKKAEDGTGSFYFETIKKDNNRRGTYMGKYLYIYLI